MPPLLELDAIRKHFGATEALAGVSFVLQPGEIHALLGENGAGKSTLMRVAYGLVRADAGRILVDGQERTVPDPRAAQKHGIGMVHQHFTSIPAFTVSENVALAAGWGPGAGLRERVRGLIAETGWALDPDARTDTLSAGLKQRLEVLKALASEARILLLDEPTSVLPPSEALAFLELVGRLRDRGIAAVLITHKLQEAIRVADRVTILRRGALVRSGPVAGETEATLAAGMLGAAPERRAPIPSIRRSERLVQAVDLGVARIGASGSGLRRANLVVRAGEVVGVAAVEGNGQRELLRALAGVAPPTAGHVEVSGPVAFIPEDRTTEALIGSLSLTENLVLALGRTAPWVRGGWLDWQAAEVSAGELLRTHAVRASGPEALAASLSGGNQQRFLVAMAGERRPRVLLFENPGRGLDLRATAEVFGMIRRAAADGAAVVVHLPDLDELLDVADRIVVLAGGVLHDLPAGATREAIGHLMLGAATP